MINCACEEYLRFTKETRRSKSTMVFIEYEVGTKVYKCFDPLNVKVNISRDVIFEENNKWDWQNEGKNKFELTFFLNVSSNE